MNLANLLLKRATNADCEKEWEVVLNMQSDNFDIDLLKSQLTIFGTNFHDVVERGRWITLFDVVKYFKGLTEAEKQLLSEVCRLLELILVMPATNAVSERSFSALRRIKTYLRSTMSQVRLNN